MEAPSRYRALVDFHNYYAGRRVAPVLTIVVGGNHEAMGYMRELCVFPPLPEERATLNRTLRRYHGGWLAPNIYYLGAAGCVLVDGWLRIAGSSGIYDARDFRKGPFRVSDLADFALIFGLTAGHHEIVPFKDREVYSSFHVRQYDFFRLWQVRISLFSLRCRTPLIGTVPAPQRRPKNRHPHALTLHPFPNQNTTKPTPYSGPTTGPNTSKNTATKLRS